MCESCKKKWDNKFYIYFFVCSRCKRIFYRFNDESLPNYVTFSEESLCIPCLKKELLTNGTPSEYFASNVLLGAQFEENELENMGYEDYHDYHIADNKSFLEVCQVCFSLSEDDLKKVVINQRYMNPNLKEAEITVYVKDE